MSDQDQPIIAWDNLLPTAAFTVLSGTLNSDTPIERLYDADMLRPCYFTPDAAGMVVIQIVPTQALSCAIIGCARNDAAGFISGATSVRFDALSEIGYGDLPYGLYGYGDLYTETVTHDLTGAPASRMLRFWSTCTQLAITFSGITGQLAFPELFVGNVLEMPWLDQNYDPYDEVTGTATFEAESGRSYERLTYRRVELAPSWGLVPRDLWPAVDAFREGALDLRKPFWFAWMPKSAPGEVYLVKHTAPSAKFAIHSAKHRSFALKLREVV